MKIEDILSEWSKDAEFDKMEPGNSAIGLAKLHHKYYEILSYERLRAYKIETDLSKLKLEKFEFFTDGPTEEQINKGWKLPPKGKLIKTVAKEYVDADKDVIVMTLKLAYQKEKMELLESIIKMIHTMGFQIKNFIEWEKFKTGA